MDGSATARALCLALIAVALVARAQAEVTVRDPGTRIVDEAHVIDADTIQKLDGYLEELEQKTTAQVKVLTVRNDDGEDIASFAQRHFDLWKLGEKGNDNGALVILDVDDHKIRIQTGYGLEGSLPDSFCGTLSRKIRDDFFRSGHYSEGIYRLTVSVANKIADDQSVKLVGVPDIRHDVPENSSYAALFMLLLFAAFMIFMVYSAMRRERHRQVWRGDLTDISYWGRVLGDVAAIGGSTWSGGSGGSSGGFGGGGGSFGGGGSSGGGGGGASW
jgi:uncharacterized protein